MEEKMKDCREKCQKEFTADCPKFKICVTILDLRDRLSELYEEVKKL